MCAVQCAFRRLVNLSKSFSIHLRSLQTIGKKEIMQKSFTFFNMVAFALAILYLLSYVNVNLSNLVVQVNSCFILCVSN